ncbi:MAG: N-acetylmuramoyl-L-alanine amidase [Nocardioides sp.]|uniref:N-acetylmuramoyl-L-alanine amidase n=1 Tax=Nocardioides sp. TaxID=35761 RepID=UPI0039E3E224
MSETAVYDPMTDAGPEVLDLPDELRLADPEEAGSYMDSPPHIPTPDLARLAGAPDYVWLTWLADELRAAGCSVVEHPGWKTRGRPRSAGPFMPTGVMWHHDASAIGPSPAMAAFIASIGRPGDGIPAPLAQLWVCMGCRGLHPVGTWHVLAAGRANHAGLGDGFGRIGRDMGNTRTVGVETDNTTGEKTPLDMLASLEVGTAAILRRLGSDPADSLCGHKEYAHGRKFDPDDIDMILARKSVAATINRQNHPHRPELVKFPGRKHFTIGHQCTHGHVKLLEMWLLELAPKSTHKSSDTFTRWTQQQVAKFQRNDPKLAGDPDGIPGPKTWRLIQLAARATR